MNDTAIVYRKVQKMFAMLGFDAERHYFTFSPFKIEFTNEDFNFLNPGAKTAEETSQDYNDKWVFAELANTLNQNKNIWKINSAEKIYDDNRYSWIINHAQLIDPELSDAEKAVYLQAKSILYKDSETIGAFEKTSEFLKYDEYNSVITKLKSGLHDKTIEKTSIDPNDTTTMAAWQAAYDELANQIKMLTAEWKIKGFKDKIESAQRTILKTNERDEFFQKWTAHKNELEFFTRERNSNQVDFFPTFCLPSEIFRADYPGWKKITIDQQELTTLDTEAQDALGEVYSTFETINADIIKIEFELLFVQIVRSWFKPDLLQCPYWKLSDESKIVSDGADLQNGILPSYPAQLVYIKNLKYYEAEKPADAPVEKPPIVNSSKLYRFKDMVRLHKAGVREEIKPVEAEGVKLQSLSKVAQPHLMRHANPDILNRLGMGQVRTKPAVETNIKHHFKKGLRFDPGLLLQRLEPATPNPAPAEPQKVSLTLSVTDVNNQPLKEIDLQVKEEQKGLVYQCETTAEGKVVLDNLLEGTYAITVKDDVNYEDKLVPLPLTTTTHHSMVLLKRKSPKVIYHLLGVINYQFPKLPNPTPGFTYS